MVLAPEVAAARGAEAARGAADRPVPRSLSTAVLLLGTVWMLFVGFQYLLVDEGRLLEVVQSIRCPVLFCFGSFGLAIGGLGYLVGRAEIASWRGRWVGRLLAAAIGLVTPPLIWQRAGDLLALTLDHQIDGLCATVLVGWAMALGIGVHLGLRGSGRTHDRLWNILTITPFVLVTTIAGAWPELLGLLWLLLIAGAVGSAVHSAVAARTGGQCQGHPLLSIAVGLACLILMTLGLGLLSLATSFCLLTLLVVLSILFLPRLLETAAQLAGRAR